MLTGCIVPLTRHFLIRWASHADSVVLCRNGGLGGQHGAVIWNLCAFPVHWHSWEVSFFRQGWIGNALCSNGLHQYKRVVRVWMQVDMSFWSFLCFDMLQLLYLQACCVWMVSEGSVLHGLGEVQVLRQSTRICRGNDRRIYERELFSFRDWVMQFFMVTWQFYLCLILFWKYVSRVCSQSPWQYVLNFLIGSFCTDILWNSPFVHT